MMDLLGVIGAALVAVLAAWWAGQRKGRNEQRQATSDDMADAYNDTTKEVRNATDDLPTDPADIRQRLRELSK